MTDLIWFPYFPGIKIDVASGLNETTCNFVYSASIAEAEWKPELKEFYYNGSPYQIKRKFPGYGTWLIFTTGSCRLLGCPSPNASEIAKRKIEENLLVELTELRLTNFTYILKVPLLNNLSQVYQVAKRGSSNVTYNPDLFNAVSIKLDKRNINIFYTGSVVVTGMKLFSQIPSIQEFIFSLLVDVLTESI